MLDNSKVPYPGYPALDKPRAPTAVDLEIGRRNGSTVALDATQARLTAAKTAPPPTLSDRVHELTRENGRLRLEIRYYQEVLEPMEAFLKRIKSLDKKLEASLVECDEVLRWLEEDRQIDARKAAINSR